MTNVRGQARNGRLVFPVAVTEQFGLREGDTVDIPQEALQVAPAVPAEVCENSFPALIGLLPLLPDGMSAVQFTRKSLMSDPAGKAGRTCQAG